MIANYKIVFCLFSLVLILNLTSDVFGQRKSKNKSQTKAAAQLATNEVRRKEVEALILQGKYQHDGSGELMYVGTMESVPTLLKVLENHPPQIYDPCAWNSKIELPPPPPPLKIPSPPPLKNGSLAPSPPPVEVSNLPQIEVPKPDCSPKKSYICTYSHAVTTLRKITGQNFFEYQDWKNWWEKYQVETKSQIVNK